METTKIIVYLILVLAMAKVATPVLLRRELELDKHPRSKTETNTDRIRIGLVVFLLIGFFLFGAALLQPPLEGLLLKENNRSVGLFVAGGATYIAVHLLMNYVNIHSMHILLVTTAIASLVFAALEDSLELELALAGGIVLDYVLKFFNKLSPQPD